MRLLIVILFCNAAIGQDYVAKFSTVPKEPNIINYQVQRSSNNITWYTLTTLQPKKSKDTNRYTYILPVADNYIRIKTLYNNYSIGYTPSIRVINTNASISNMVYGINSNADKLSFTATNEAAANYYLIYRKNSSSTTWVLVGKLMQTNKRNYTVNITKVGSNRSYRLQVVYKNEIVSPYISF